jgi:hypothetical protein
VGRGQYSEEVRVTLGVPQGSVLGPPLSLASINEIWRDIQSNIRLYADDCILYRKILDVKDIEEITDRFGKIGEWAVENEMKINRSERKRDPLNYCLRNQNIP